MFNFLRSLIDNEKMGEEIIKANVRTYFMAKEMYPEGNEYDWLIATYCGRLRARFEPINIEDVEYFCSKFLHIQEPDNARALGLAILHKERFDIVERYPKFSEELEILLKN